MEKFRHFPIEIASRGDPILSQKNPPWTMLILPAIASRGAKSSLDRLYFFSRNYVVSNYVVYRREIHYITIYTFFSEGSNKIRFIVPNNRNQNIKHKGEIRIKLAVHNSEIMIMNIAI